MICKWLGIGLLLAWTKQNWKCNVYRHGSNTSKSGTSPWTTQGLSSLFHMNNNMANTTIDATVQSEQLLIYRNSKYLGLLPYRSMTFGTQLENITQKLKAETLFFRKRHLLCYSVAKYAAPVRKPKPLIVAVSNLKLMSPAAEIIFTYNSSIPVALFFLSFLFYGKVAINML